jgi:exopolysaccharide biosynthesis polyprenyl glycosylphosphotransferase
VSAAERAVRIEASDCHEEKAWSTSERTPELLERRHKKTRIKSRGWLIRRMLLAADVVGLLLAFSLAEALTTPGAGFHLVAEYWLFVATLPLWVIAARLTGLYDGDEERTHHTTVDDLLRVFTLVTVGAFLFERGTAVTRVADVNVTRLTIFWSAAIALVPALRVTARAIFRRQSVYVQNAIIVGADDVAQRIARKLLQHPEYGINALGFVDAGRQERGDNVRHLAMLGGPEKLPDLVRSHDVERVIVAFPNSSRQETVDLVRALKGLNVHIDFVPRLFELLGPVARVHAVEGLPLLGLPPARISRSDRLMKRTIDIVGALVGLLVASPFFAYVAWRIKRESPGPVFFRQRRLGMDMLEFTALKFRTMEVGADQEEHRRYIRHVIDPGALPKRNGLYKLDRADVVTTFGRWLRKTSLDELPQLVNVLRGEMSLVGPRPCIPYETETFAPHHFERFLVPAGLTGLWQVTARAHSTFGEALDLDVAYARGWSLRLDLSLLFKTPFQLVLHRGTA